MKRVSAAFALTAVAAATIALAQTAPAEPPASTEQQQTNPTTQPSDPGARSDSGRADPQALMKDCIKQVQAANPNVPQKDIKEYCDKQVKSQSSSPHD
jgi:hypothetical protein